MAYLKYNLQFFAKDGPGGEKTEPATQKKLSDARKDGNVAKSREIVTAVTLLVAFVFLKVYIGKIGNQLMEQFPRVYNKIPTIASAYSDEVNIKTVSKILQGVFADLLLIMAPILVLMFAVNFFGDFVQFKWKVTSKPLRPKLNKISPLKGFKRIFSKQSLMNLAKSVALVIIIGYMVIQEIRDKMGILFELYNISLPAAIYQIGSLAIALVISISASYIIVGLMDFVWL